jgi:hypothetical protein
MAIYRLYLEKDASIYSEANTSNTGKDEILELGSYKDNSNTNQVIRTLVKFSTEEINNIVDTLTDNQPISASLNLFLAEASEIPIDFDIECFLVSQSWDNGRGKFGDIPIDRSGVSWGFRNLDSTNSWIPTAFNTDSTGSYYNQIGGGTWLLTSSSFQTFNETSDLDIKLDITPLLNGILTGSFVNNGLILKLPNDIEKTPESNIRLRYFSNDTQTIYVPFIEIKWNDFIYTTGSLNVVDSSNLTLSIRNLKENLPNEGKYRFRIGARPRYPIRTFSTSSIYLTQYALPEESYWALEDEYTGDKVYDFEEFTKISCDNLGPYFDVYLNTLQPERYYRVLIKTNINGSTQIINNSNIFKVTKNG